MPRDTRPNGEADPSTIRVGLSFFVNWLFVFDERRPEAFVYEVYERDVSPLAPPIYVGVTNGFSARWSAHRANSWWFTEAQVGCVLLSGYASRTAGRRAEASLIAEHSPRFNIKPERRHLQAARANTPDAEMFTAELLPRPRKEAHCRAV